MENQIKITDLVSIEYLPLLVKYNQAGHGKTGGRQSDNVTRLMTPNDPYIKTVLDYGCGQGTLIREVAKKTNGFELHEYDPAVPGKSSIPTGLFDLVVCTDVLEHVEPEKIDSVLAHIESLAGKRAFFVIATRPAILILADGRNAHLIIKTGDWWVDKIKQAFRNFPVIGADMGHGEITITVEKWVQS